MRSRIVAASLAACFVLILVGSPGAQGTTQPLRCPLDSYDGGNTARYFCEIRGVKPDKKISAPTPEGCGDYRYFQAYASPGQSLSAFDRLIQPVRRFQLRDRAIDRGGGKDPTMIVNVFHSENLTTFLNLSPFKVHLGYSIRCQV